MTARAHFGDLLTPGFRKIYSDTYSEIPTVKERIFHMETSDKADEKDSSLSGFGLAVEVGEGAPVPYEDPVQGYDSTYTHIKYGKGFKITQEMYEDDLYREMNKRPAALGKAMRRTAENQAALVFVRAFSTSYLGADGKPLCSISHSRSDGGTAQSNASATGIVFNETNLNTGRLAMRGQLDEKGQKIEVLPKVILYESTLDKTVHEVIDSEKRQGTADNDLNYNKGKYETVEWMYLTSTTAWFLIDPSTHQLNWFWRRQPKFASDELFDTEYAVYKSTMRLSRGWSDWRGIWGSAGDAASYGS